MKILKTILLTVFTLAIFAGVFVCTSPTTAEALEPWNVVADVECQGRVYHYDLSREITPYLSKAAARGFYLGARAKKQLADQLVDSGLYAPAVYDYLLPGFRKMTKYFDFVNVEKSDAEVSFDRNGFHYKEGVDGVSVDCDALFRAMLKSGGATIKVQLPLAKDKAVSVADLKADTVKKASFTTYYRASGVNRSFNIAKATAAIDGITIGAGESFSFNDVVGPRTEKEGYRTSKVIMYGQYADGVGGGVCQVSTTLYNALLLSEIIPRASQHTLVSSYVAAGFDAMVSYGGADLTFVNQSEHPLYISAKTDGKNKSVTFTVYGEPNRYRVVRESVETRTKFDTVEVVDKIKYPELVYTDQTKVLVNGSDGVKSSSYLNYYDGDKLAFRKLIRQNTYKLVNKVVARGYEERPNEPTEEQSALYDNSAAA